jgi:cation:H+ antiporter
VSIFFLVFGLVALYFGSDWFVNGAVNLARNLGLSDSIIGVTVVALGTSAPELVASIMAAIKKQSDISIGNLVGSNVFNVFAVLGCTSLVTPVSVDQSVLDFDYYWVAGSAMVLIPVIYFGVKIGKVKGILLLVVYILYLFSLILKIKGVI